ncbi:hypothetical protein [Kitasatospora sp. NPDC101183]|uniref:hypothetical protein n=1 Tax=Kitasatospora sp. NPDC101183 TaxID=3364100 RepID=UPI0038287398
MDTEDMVRGALREEAGKVAVADWSAGPALAHVRRQRRARRAALGAGAVAAALVVVAGTGALLSAPSAVQAAAPAPKALLVPEGQAPEALAVQPGQQVPLGRPDWWMKLNDREVCIHDAPAYKDRSDCGGHSWSDGATQITMGYYGNPPEYRDGLYNLVYQGPGKVARMSVEMDGKASWVTVASLPGEPGFATGWFWGPPAPKSTGGSPAAFPFEGVQLAAYDAQGKLLARNTVGS